MIGIMKKDYKLYIFYLLLVSAFPFLNIMADGMERAVVTGLGNMMVLSVVMAAAANELLEDKNRGYLILNSIPVTDFQIVAGKHMLVLLFTLINVVFDLSILFVFSETREFFILGRGYIVLTAHFCIVFSAAVYYCIYRFGFTMFVRVGAFGLPVVFLVIPLLLLMKYGKQWREMDLAPIAEMASMGKLLLISVLALMLYALIMSFSVKAKKKGEV